MTRLPIDTMTARAAFVSRVLANAPTTETDPDDPVRRWFEGDKSVGDLKSAQEKANVRRAAESARHGMKVLRDRLAAGCAR